MPTTVLLGPQRFTPTLGAAVAAVGVRGRLASVTAGWQEREAEDTELHEHLGERTENLMLYARSEDAFEKDPDLFAAHRERQDRLRELQEVYRLRLGFAKEEARQLLGRQGDAAVLDPEREAAIRRVRELDDHHLVRLSAVHREFEAAWEPTARPAVAHHRREIERVLARVEALAVAGGHVAILLNRLRLFGLRELVAERVVFAWSAGAMAMTERVVLFHDFPPQGQGNAEVLEAGWGRAPGIVVLPHARRRLALDDRRRVAILARRFAPAEVVALEDGGRTTWDGVRWRAERGALTFASDGVVSPAEEV
ncbi:MAG: Type 1 glutamine amidotransferase-like domain-containing protein [Thermoanaerobaculia bacterium]